MILSRENRHMSCDKIIDRKLGVSSCDAYFNIFGAESECIYCFICFPDSMQYFPSFPLSLPSPSPVHRPEVSQNIVQLHYIDL